METVSEETAQALQRDWGIQLPERHTKDAILKLLADRIVTILESGPDAFFQLMYRLDIPEKKLHPVLGDEDVPMKIATLVYDRQLQKMESRRKFSGKPDQSDPDLQW